MKRHLIGATGDFVDAAGRASTESVGSGPVETVEHAPDVLVETETPSSLDRPWRVVLFNDEIHTFEEVIGQLILATSCTASQAEAHAWTVHTKGKAFVFEDAFEPCLQVQSVLRRIALRTEIQG